MEQSKSKKEKIPRINLAFYGDNLDYVRKAAHDKWMSVTEYVNHLIEEDRKHNSIAKKTDK